MTDMRRFLIGVALTVLMAGPALAADVISVRYDISLGGTRVMKADYSATMNVDSYSASLEAKTVGVSKMFSKIKLNLSANGSVTEAGLVPASYNYSRKKNDKRRERSLNFTPTGALITEGADYGEGIRSALSSKVMDPLSMLLKLGLSDKPCSGKHRAFDGRDVFDVSLSGGGKGGTLNCKMVYTPVAGSDVEDGKTDPTSYDITLAPLGQGKGYVPIRIAGSTKGVGFEVSAAEVAMNGSALNY
jgi:opacity protein-like surface antigen